ncbi:aldose 1-epimerase family protein [Clostridium sp. Ade.TY]|uniref:aldose 1-epimerase family protein n=1 Tax=Clostridium sp. Ade.TY TaxID=1391647 RepID=UPI0003FEE447|nr:aldose 1-epimerase family protein [Clostridium sp. Ade.TY]
MLYTLENELVKITASTYGAELHNLISKKDNTEFLWNGDATYWKYHSPVLFPIVGKVKDGKYRAEGNIYELPQHGLGRISNYEMIDQTSNSITFELKYSEDTLKVYPYKFSLKIKYTLIENSVKVSYIVENLDNKTIYFSIGAHPAFLCSIEPNETIDDYYFEFNEKENVSTMLLNKDGYFIKDRKQFLNNENIINLSKELFQGDALVFDNLKSNEISLKSKNHSKFLTMNFEGFPFMGLWSKFDGAPFVCIEPWYGHADFFDFDGELKDKAGIQKLNIGEIFEVSYTLTLS